MEKTGKKAKRWLFLCKKDSYRALRGLAGDFLLKNGVEI
jgi:hypothetical protein